MTYVTPMEDNSNFSFIAAFFVIIQVLTAFLEAPREVNL